MHGWKTATPAGANHQPRAKASPGMHEGALVSDGGAIFLPDQHGVASHFDRHISGVVHSNCFQSERAKPKSKSRVNRPGGLPNMFSRIRSRAVAPVRKNGKRNAFAVCATALSGSRTSGLTGLRSWKIWRDVLFIDQFRCFKVPCISRSHQVGVGEYWRDHVACPGDQILVPKGIEHLYVTVDICSEPELCYQLCRVVSGINR